MSRPEEMSSQEIQRECLASTDEDGCKEALHEALHSMHAHNQLDRELREAQKANAKPSVEFVWSCNEQDVCRDAQGREVNERGGIIVRDKDGRISTVAYPDGLTYEFDYNRQSRDLYQWDASGMTQPAKVIIRDQKSGSYAQWVNEGGASWRAYDGDKPRNIVMIADWTLDERGNMNIKGESELVVSWPR